MPPLAWPRYNLWTLRREVPISDASPQVAVPFGKYQLLKRVAAGGMAEVFLARDGTNGALVAIKRILPHLAGDLSFVRMFLDEARIAAQIHHPNVVKVHELGKLDNAIFLTMEFVEGSDVRKVMSELAKKRLQMPYGVAARIAAEVARGLHFAHNSRGVDGKPLEVVHRDVSPQNVMVDFDGNVKLVDFGIARAGAFMEASNPGILKGKFLYLSPEQVSQEKVDHRADLFSLGTLLYEMSVGRSPFLRTTGEAVIFAVGHEEPAPPSLLRPDYPHALASIVLRCLQKDRRKRYQDAAQVADALEQFLREQHLSGDIHAVSRFLSSVLGSAEERTTINMPLPAISPTAPSPTGPSKGEGLVPVPVLGPMPPGLLRPTPHPRASSTPPPPPLELTPSLDVLRRPPPDVIIEDLPPEVVTKAARFKRMASQPPPDAEVSASGQSLPSQLTSLDDEEYERTLAEPRDFSGLADPRGGARRWTFGLFAAVLLLVAGVALFAWSSGR